MIKRENEKEKRKRNPAFRFENQSDQMVTILFKQQQKGECLVFSQWLGPRAQRSLCLLFQLEEVGFTLVRKLLQRPGKRPEVTDLHARDLRNQSMGGASVVPHSLHPTLTSLPSRKV